MATLKLIFGAGMFTKDHGFNSSEDVQPWLDILLENKAKGLVSEVDTAAAYQQSEGFLGQLKFGSHFAIGTKLPGGSRPDQPSTKENVIFQAKESLTKLYMKQVDILFLHCPDARVPLEDTLAGVDALYKDGSFKRFGLSNHTMEEVEKVLKICKQKSFVLPSVYEGMYSAMARLPEDELLPMIRKHNISYYAYSPISGGFLAKTAQQFHDQSFKGRWEKSAFLGMVYQYMYNKPVMLEALKKWHEIAETSGMSAVEMAYRWVVHNSALDASLGDGIVIGASSIEQWENNLAAIQKGPLSAETAAKIDALWTADVKANAVFDNWQAMGQIMSARK